MPPRTHTKSRNGCLDCKQRKVKCDERSPTCFNCARRGIRCSLASGVTDTPNRSPSAGRSRSLQPSNETDQRHAQLPAPETEPWDCGLELMHHYTIATADTLALRNDMQYVWRVTIPEIAYQNPFVMRGILAVAAVHKAYLLPNRRSSYLDLAAYHQMRGLEAFRAAIHDLSDENWKPCFCFASIIALLVCSSGMRIRSELRSDDSVPDILELFTFVRGIRTVLLPYQTRVLDSTLGPLARGVWIVNPEDPSYRHPSLEHSALPYDIFIAIFQLSEFLDANLVGDKRENYKAAVADFEKVVFLIAHAGTHPEAGMIILIPYMFPDSIMTDIEAVDPYALVLLSYFSVLSKLMETRFWFLRGWAERLFAVIDSRLVGRPILMDMVKWPRLQVFKIFGGV
ncbi:hypothetical protein F4781DRAFT_394089 [Annulohypoxylon bovei var. microspora]|nr:hypothetical protein F4781DRAFT_394089 [Annulohypoxylon bovei var. microspora]